MGPITCQYQDEKGTIRFITIRIFDIYPKDGYTVDQRQQLGRIILFKPREIHTDNIPGGISLEVIPAHYELTDEFDREVVDRLSQRAV
ncbi:MAG: hypothetical protein PHZ04_02905 [Patescibacteria group bacterium]|nr:hypothetical protein [Patescibacteria group bacterium]MDD5294556.1 hypothetical protein [Patescibacteria group bacterium]MDD5554653.1 hypothetical protein [Patescibacteria group bacterium]